MQNDYSVWAYDLNEAINNEDFEDVVSLFQELYDDIKAIQEGDESRLHPPLSEMMETYEDLYKLVDEWEETAKAYADMLSQRPQTPSEKAEAAHKNAADEAASEEEARHQAELDADEEFEASEIAQRRKDLNRLEANREREAEDKRKKNEKGKENALSVLTGVLGFLKDSGIDAVGMSANVPDSAVKSGPFHALHGIFNRKLIAPRNARVAEAFGKLLEDFEQRVEKNPDLYGKQWADIERTIYTFQRQLEARVEKGFNPTEAYLRGLTRYLDRRISDRVDTFQSVRGAT